MKRSEIQQPSCCEALAPRLMTADEVQDILDDSDAKETFFKQNYPESNCESVTDSESAISLNLDLSLPMNL